jgi:phospholipase/carboxylesterase
MEQLHTDLIPAREPSARLLVALHGLGDSMEGYRDVPQLLQIPSLNVLLVNAPDSYYGGFSWFDFAGDFQPGILRSRRLLTQLLDSLREKYPTDQTVLFGFSQGCLMTMETGLRYPHTLAALIGVSGWVYDAEALVKDLSPVAKEQRILWTHGTRDTLLRIDEVRPKVETLKNAGLNIQWREFQKEHTFLPQEFTLIREFILKAFA